MKIETIKKETMEAMRTLTDVNMEISKAKVSLSNLHKDRKAFIELRKKDVLKDIDLLLKNSSETLEEISKNTEGTKALFNSVKGFSDFLEEAHDDYSKIVEDLTKQQDTFSEYVKSENSRLSEIKTDLEAQRKEIADIRKSFDSREKSIKDSQKRLDSRRVALDTAIKDTLHKPV